MFFITGLPRSRTAWFSAFMTNANVYCHHEALKLVKDKEGFNRVMNIDYKHVGNSDCGLFISDFQHRFPTAKTVIIHRNIDDVFESLSKCGRFVDMDILRMAEGENKKLKGMHVEYDDINDNIMDIHRYCVGHDADENRVELFKNLNIQVQEQSAAAPVELWRV